MKPFANHPYRALGLSLFTFGAAVSSALTRKHHPGYHPAWNGTDQWLRSACRTHRPTADLFRCSRLTTAFESLPTSSSTRRTGSHLLAHPCVMRSYERPLRRRWRNRHRPRPPPGKSDHPQSHRRLRRGRDRHRRDPVTPGSSSCWA